MIHAENRAQAGQIHITWDDGFSAAFPYFWLVDSDPAGFHPETRERAFDLTTVDPALRATDLAVADGHLTVTWSGSPGQSRYDLDWLRTHRPGQRRADPADIAPVTWRSDLGARGVPRWRAADIAASDGGLRAWMTQTKELGLSIVTDLPDDRLAGAAIARRIAPLRLSNYGDGFEVRTEPNPNNLAMTSLALPLHTDQPYYENPPGVQFLHCIANQATGGGSVFVDGFAVAEDFKTRHPAQFDLLTRLAIPFRFLDNAVDIRTRHPILVTDTDGRISELCFNAHIGDVVDLPPEDLADFYPAYLTLMRMLRDPAYAVRLKLQTGEMVVFDNRRILHGRDAFDPSSGLRHLHGCYVDRGDFDSRLRKLAED